MVFVRGADQAEFVSRLRGVSGDRVLLVPVDVGKRSAMSRVANQLGELIVDPFEFLLDRPGVDLLLDRVAAADEAAGARVVRFGIEAAGHHHRTLTTVLQAEQVEVVELHLGAVHKARAEMGQRRLKSDLRDLAAMVELMARGTGCEAACPCVFLGPPTEDDCTVIVAGHIDEGALDEVTLDGLIVAMAAYSPGHMVER